MREKQKKKLNKYPDGVHPRLVDAMIKEETRITNLYKEKDES
jgi:hypothetical protein